MTECPQPHTRARLATDGEVPLAAQRIRKLAEVHEWSVVATYARGPLLGANGLPGRTVSSCALRMARGRRGLVAIWHRSDAGKWTFEIAYAWLKAQRFFPERLSAAQLRTSITVEQT